MDIKNRLNHVIDCGVAQGLLLKPATALEKNSGSNSQIRNGEELSIILLKF